MKKTLLTTTFLVAGAFSLLAQGLVSFYNDPYSWNNSVENGGAVNYLVLQQAWNGTIDTRVPVADATWSVQLYEGTSQTPNGARIPFYGTDWPGVWNAFADPNQGARTLSVAGGVQTMLSVGVFNAAGQEVVRSEQFAFTPSTSATPPPSDLLMSGLGTLNGGLGGIFVPEPSTVALGVLGLGALLLFRRRK